MNTSTTIHLRLKHQHEAIKELIANTSKERVHYHPAPGKWSIHDNITHLATYQPVFIERLKLILNEDAPAFGRYRADDDLVFEECRKFETQTIIERLHNDRKTIVELASKLSKEQLNRIGVHKKFGNLILEMWLEFFLLHEAHHLFTIFQLANDVEII